MKMKKRFLSMLLVIVMLMSFSLSLTVSAAQTEASIVFYDVMTKEAITDLEGVGSTYAKVSFSTPQKETAFIICTTYDGDNKLLATHICETVSTASEYTTENIDLTGARTIKLFVFDSSQNLVPLCTQATLTRTTDDGTVALAFDDKSRVTAGAYDPEAYVEADIQGAYDNAVKSVTSGITGVQNVNTNMPYHTGNAVYQNRNYVYTTLDLTDKLPAKKVTVNFVGTVTSSGASTMYIEQMDRYPEAGENIVEGTQLAKAAMSAYSTDVAYSCDITEAYNKAIGSKLYLRVYGWYGNNNPDYIMRVNSAVKINTNYLNLSVTPSTGNDFKITFSEGAEEFTAGVFQEITLPECTSVIAGRKFAGWSDGKNVYNPGDKYTVISSVEFTAQFDKDPTTYTAAQKALDGKKVMFIGNSYVYYGHCVMGKDRTAYTWNDRKEDKGYFYQLCKQNNIDVAVRNWCFTGHTLSQTFDGPCTSTYAECAGIDHESHIEDRYLDYVIVSPHGSDSEQNNIATNFAYVMDFFKAYNSDVKFVLLGNHAAHGLTNTGVEYTEMIEYYKTLEEMGVIIADWGEMVNDIANGTVAVPGATQTYNKNTFVNTNDEYHENSLAGYITALSAFCAITDETAVGQPYGFCSDSSINSKFDLVWYRDKYYKNATDTNFIEVFNSPADMLGLQKLVDKYINPELLVPVTLTLVDCDNAGTTTYDKDSEITLETPTKTAQTADYTFTGWTDGTNTYAAGDKLKLNQNMTLTATWTQTKKAEAQISFDDISVIKMGAWDPTTSAYDNTVKSITQGVTGWQQTNVNKSGKNNGTDYYQRPFIYACIDLKNEVAVEKVLLNVKATLKGKSYIYVYHIDGYPAVGDTYVAGSGTKLATFTYTAAAEDVTNTCDITEVFNNAVGSKLYFRIYGWYGNADRYPGQVTIDTSSLNMTATQTVE